MEENEKPMKRDQWVPLVIIGTLVVILIVLIGPLNTLAFLQSTDRPMLERLTPEQLMEISNMLAIYIKMRTVLAVINMGLLVYLMFLYGGSYRETKSNFSLCLLLLSVTLFLYAITSNPIIVWVNGFQAVSVWNIFNILPDIFTTLASAILIYLSRQ